MKLRELLTHVLVRQTHGDLDVEVDQVRSDSRKVEPGDVFAAQNDVYHQGDKFIGAALEAGARALVVETLPEGLPAELPVVVVPNAAEALAHMSAARFGQPSTHLDLIGVTGTNGKTTTCHLLEPILLMAGRTPGLIGTAIGARYAGKTLNTGLTTPEAPELQAILSDMVRDGVNAAAIEVSSHGIALKRSEGCAFAIGVLTGIGRDHLDFHESQQAYVDTKVNWLLGEVQQSPTCRGAVVPWDDPAGQEVLSEFRKPILTFGYDEEADIYPTALELQPTLTRGRIATPEGTLTLELRGLPGRHNVRNAMAAIGTALLLGVEPISIVEGLQRFSGVPGRLEPVPNNRGISVLVDYAHTPDALQATIAALREVTEGRIVVVFGCGGDRDKEKRPEMARVAHRGADVLVVTSDNPRSEDPVAIIDEILLGIPADATPETVHVEVDRKLAIEKAIGLAATGDLVLVAGKGHERGQTSGGQTIPFDDRAVCAEVLAR